MACGFRDHALSDLIGFVYAGWPADGAADDFVGRLVDAGRRAPAGRRGRADDLRDPRRRERLGALRRRRPAVSERAVRPALPTHPELRTVTMAEACAAPPRTLQGIFPGSWIDANFYIWIGHADDQRAWSQLAEARTGPRRGRRRTSTPTRWRAPARRCSSPKAATGAGGTATTTRLNTTSSLTSCSGVTCGTSIGSCNGPSRTSSSSATSARGAPVQITARRPHLAKAGRRGLELLRMALCRDAGLARRRSDAPGRPAAASAQVQFGFDRDALFLRVDGSRPARELLAEGWAVGFTFLTPGGFRVSCCGSPAGAVRPAGAARRRVLAPCLDCRLAVAGPIMSWDSVADLGPRRGDAWLLRGRCDANENEMERHRRTAPIELDGPDAGSRPATGGVGTGTRTRQPQGKYAKTPQGIHSPVLLAYSKSPIMYVMLTNVLDIARTHWPGRRRLRSLLAEVTRQLDPVRVTATRVR